MAIYITGPVAELNPRSLSIAFDQKTWGFSIVANGTFHALSPDASYSLIQEIEKAVAEGRKRQRSSDNGGEQR